MLPLKRWWRQYLEDRNQEDYDRGFGWVCCQILVYGVSPETLEELVLSSIQHSVTPFDRGCLDALVVLDPFITRLQQATHVQTPFSKTPAPSTC